MAASEPVAGAPVVYAVILNWNGWHDTLPCLESLLQCDYPNLRVIVCDNGSTDTSQTRIREWAAGHLEVPRPAGGTLRRLIGNNSPAPVELQELDRAAATRPSPPRAAAPLVLIQNGRNLGFAGGNNVGLRYALAQPDCDYVWLLNNDTLVARDALSEMVARLQAEPGAGVCGATLLDYDRPRTVQALAGARFNPWLGTIAPVGAGLSLDDRPPATAVEAALDYVIGACMLVSRSWLEEVGLLSEDYFLYFEEVDWASRAAGRYRQVYAPRSLVYHKQGASIGGPAANPRMDGLALRNRLRFTRRHHPWALPTVWLGMTGVLLLRILRRQWRHVPVVLGVMFGYWRWQR